MRVRCRDRFDVDVLADGSLAAARTLSNGASYNLVLGSNRNDIHHLCRTARLVLWVCVIDVLHGRQDAVHDRFELGQCRGLGQLIHRGRPPVLLPLNSRGCSVSVPGHGPRPRADLGPFDYPSGMGPISGPRRSDRVPRGPHNARGGRRRQRLEPSVPRTRSSAHLGGLRIRYRCRQPRQHAGRRNELRLPKPALRLSISGWSVRGLACDQGLPDHGQGRLRQRNRRTLGITLREDDGSPRHVPSDRVLASAVAPLVTFPHVVFDAPASLDAGKLYHVVFENLDPEPTRNFVSIDGLYVDPATTPRQPQSQTWTGLN